MKRLLLWAVFLMTALYFSYTAVSTDSGSHYKVPGSYKSLDLFSYIRAYPDSDIPSDGYTKAYQQHLKLKEGSESYLKSADKKWNAVGPLNTAGRTLTINVNPQDPNTVYLGSASGGLWRSRDLGDPLTWEYVPTGFPVLGVSTIAFPESDSMTMYIGTGEVYNFFNTGTDGAFRSTRGSYGIGILKSTDGGKSWSKSLDWSYQQNHGVWMIKVSPQDPNIVYAATTQGIYKTVDAGQNWDRVLDVVMATDLEIDPRDDDKVIISCGNFGTQGKGIYRTTDGGLNWLKTSSNDWFNFQGKILLARSESNPNVLYASVGNGFSGPDGATWLLRTNDNGRNWQTVNTLDYSRWQGWFSHDVAVHPEDENKITAIGIDVYQSDNGGIDLIQKTSGGVTLGTHPIDQPDGGPQYSHSDHHFVMYHPDLEDVILIGNDGGMFISFDGGQSVESRNGGLQTTQFYNGFSISQTDTSYAMGGLQDNSTVIYRGDGAWQRAIGGDGSWSAINQKDNSVVFGSYQNLNILRSMTNGNSFTGLNLPFPGDEQRLFISPYVLSDSDDPVMYCGATYIYRSDDLGANFTVCNQGNKLNGDPAFSMDVYNDDPDIVYVGTVGLQDSPRVFSTRNGGETWQMSGNSFPDRIPNDIAIHPFDPSIAYVCFSGFNSDHLYRTEDFGASWEAIGAGLPDVPTNAIAIDPADPQLMYLGSDIAVYISRDAGYNWEVYGEQLPDAVIAMDLKINRNSRKLWLATHGNGSYNIDLESSSVSTEDVALEEANTLNIYPNPTSDLLEIRSDDGTVVEAWNIYDLMGRKVLSGQGNKAVVSNLEPGQYLINIVIDKRSMTKRFVLI